MKKIFIGCGIVVLLLLGGVAFLTWRFWGDFTEMRVQATQAVERLNAIAAAQPFDPSAQAGLDTERFAQALDVRALLAADLVQIGTDMEEMQRKEEAGETDIGFFELWSQMFKAVTGLMPNFAARLEETQMSWPEFAWHTRVMWSVLYRVDIGVGEPDLEPLRDRYTDFKAKYDELRRQQEGLPELRDLLGEFPPAVLSSAAAIMAKDTQRVERGLRVPEVEHLYMMPVTTTDELKYVEMPADTEARIKSAQPAPEPEPAPAPK
jgi:hypothetical protein